ncbi:MerR family transcriptional regulator [Fusobacterium sp.]|uniref:helix-turn-helix domain-containing protein n=1 Tax=Fusobacterium sp. TaxID=68766 RepID=UPI002901AD1E|nr:MerR family transcriptional regulator [Fusobacterium sp.]MDU1910463.1 MerR family transcriptional regulator [Fusobacterium sp.]
MQKYFLIGEISELLKIPRSTLRYYDREGVISPKFRKENNYRYYTRAQIITIKKITTMRKLGLTLDEIKVFFNEKKDEKEKKDEVLIENVLERINEDIEKLKMVKEDLQIHLERMKRSSKILIGIPFIKEIKSIKGIKVYEKENRKTLTFPNKKILELINEYDGKILFYITKKKLSEMSDVNILGSGYIVVKGDKKVEENIIEKGKYVCMFLKGNHFENSISIKRLIEWIEENNFKRVNEEVNIIIEPENLSIKRREDIFYKVSILIE